MDVFADYLSKIDNIDHRMRTEEVLNWTAETFLNLEPVIKWNQPMFTDHGTYVIGYSVSKKHLAVAPEQAGINQFLEDIERAGYGHTKELIRIPWTQPVDYSLLKNIIAFNIEDKMDVESFWR